MSNIYIHTHTLRIWTILSLHESTHLIGTKSIQIRIGKRMRQRKKVRYFASNDYQNLHPFLQPDKSTAALGKGKFVRERTEKNHGHIIGLYQVVFWVPLGILLLILKAENCKESIWTIRSILESQQWPFFSWSFSWSCYKQQPFSLN